MKVSLIAAAALAPLALAQNSTNITSYLTTVLGALQGAGLTSLVSVASAIANTSSGMALLAGLATGNHTVFAPSNDAFSAVPANVSSNTTLLTEVLAYHILNSAYTVNGTAVAPNHTIAGSSLYGGPYSLPGNQTAPLVLARNSSNASSFNIIQATSNISTQGPVAAANLLVYIIPQVISLPGTIADVAAALFPSLAGVIQSTGLLTPLVSAPALTIFAPNNAAIGNIQSALGSLNTTQIQTILANHVINGSVVYSTNLLSSNYISAAGEPFNIFTNSSGTYVQSANSTATIVQSDIITNNGVVHIIDNVLVNTASNASAAASAYASGTSAAAVPTSSVSAVTATSAPAGSGSAGASGSASSSKAAADPVAPIKYMSSFIGAAIGVIGVVIGGGFVLA